MFPYLYYSKSCAGEWGCVLRLNLGRNNQEAIPSAKDAMLAIQYATIFSRKAHSQSLTLTSRCHESAAQYPAVNRNEALPPNKNIAATGSTVTLVKKVACARND